MADNEETKQENGEEAAAVEEQPAAEEPKAEEVAEEPKAEEPKAEEVAEEPKAKPAAKKAAKSGKTPAIDGMLDTIKNMTVLELADLVKAIETEFGVSAAAPVAVAAAGAPAEAAVAAEEQTEFTVTLKDFGANKISVIRVVRELTSLGLKESKDLVEAAPKPIVEGVSKDDASSAKSKLEEAGATADIS